jgi:ankyrin repeat protein
MAALIAVHSTAIADDRQVLIESQAAILNGQAALLESLYSSGIKVHEVWAAAGSSIYLYAATATPDPAVLAVLEASGAPITGYKGWSAIDYACLQNKSASVIEYLHKKGDRVTFENWPMIAFTAMALRKNFARLDYLFSIGLRAESTWDGLTLIGAAFAATGFIDSTERLKAFEEYALYLLERGVSPASRIASYSPGKYALDVGSESVLSALLSVKEGAALASLFLDNGAFSLPLKPIDSRLLLYAARNHPSIAERLIGSGFAVDLKSAGGETSLQAAIGLSDADTALALIDLGADPRQSSKGGKTVLHILPSISLSGKHSVTAASVASLIKRGIDPDKKDAGGDTALHLAASANAAPRLKDEIMLALLENGADPNIRNGAGMVPLQLWLDSGFSRGTQNEKLLSLFLSRTKVRDVPWGNGDTVLHWLASIYGRDTDLLWAARVMVPLFKDSLERRNYDDLTPLMLLKKRHGSGMGLVEGFRALMITHGAADYGIGGYKLTISHPSSAFVAVRYMSYGRQVTKTFFQPPSRLELTAIDDPRIEFAALRVVYYQPLLGSEQYKAETWWGSDSFWSAPISEGYRTRAELEAALPRYLRVYEWNKQSSEMELSLTMTAR